MLKGPSHAEGGIPIEVEGGEYIIKKKSVNKRTEPVLEYINENGKLPGNMDYDFPTTDARDRSKIMPGVKNKMTGKTVAEMSYDDKGIEQQIKWLQMTQI